MNVEITLNPGIGDDLGPNFLITSNVEGWSDTATDVELYAGVEVTVPDEATVVYIQSLGLCFNILTLPIEETTTTTSSTSTTTTSTTEVPETTTTTTTYVEVPCEEGYGLLYNWYAIEDVRSLSNTGWHIPNNNEWTTLQVFLGEATAGKKLKEAGFVYWPIANTGINEVGFNGRRTSVRSGFNGTFINFTDYSYMASSTISGSNRYTIILSTLADNLPVPSSSTTLLDNGQAVRFIKDSTTLSHAQTGIYTGNDGKVYRTICIGTQEWLADNLQETRFRNGDIIPYHGADNGNNFTNAEWAALTTAGVCAYDNDVANVGCDFVFPEEETTTTTTTTEG